MQPDQNKSQLRNLRHSCSHLLGAAILQLYPGSNLAIGPATDDGFYYDVDTAQPISDADFARIEQKMHEISKTWKSFDRREVTQQEASALFKDNPYKLEIIAEHAAKGETLTIYQSGEFIDLCAGGHIQNPASELKYFSLLSVAGAYWRGSEKNKMLTRIYGTCFPTKEDLAHYKLQQEEAKQRDHRKIGKEQKLFFIDEMIGKGLIIWLPNGTIIRDQIEAFARKTEKDAGYVRVVTPHIAKEELYLTSGHLPLYKASMYPSMQMDDGTYRLKPMNCPHHHRIFQHMAPTYKEMPLRLAEYGTCYRNELSGTLAGLLRVRGMAMNDAHIYCTKDQIKTEFAAVLQMTIHYFSIFGLKDYWFRLSKWGPHHPEKYTNDPKNWEYTQTILREVLTMMKLPFVEADDEAAFYGPKVDVQFRSVLGREETMSTIQLDFFAKTRFGLQYIDADGKENHEVFVIHRAPLSVHERFLAFLIEQYAGKFPVWLSPVQVAILPISDKHNESAYAIAKQLEHAHIRTEVYGNSKTLGAKIRMSTLQKVPYMIIMGDKEQQASASEPFVSVRTRDGKDMGGMKLTDFINIVHELIETYQ